MRKKLNGELKIGLVIVAVYAAWAILWLICDYFIWGSIHRPYIPEMNLSLELTPPLNSGFILGADVYGRSLLETLSMGLLYSLSIASIVSFTSASIGILVGYLTVKGGQRTRLIFDLTTNIIFILPGILIAILVMSVAGQSMKGLIFALILTGWTGYAKISRGEVKRILALPYVESAKAIGMGEIRLFFKVVFPALLPIILVNVVMGFSGVILSEAALGFLGLGGSPYSWGNILSGAKTVILEAPHVAVVASLTLGGLIVGLNLLGDGLRDYLDPRQELK